MIFICIFAKSLVSSRTRLGTAKLIYKRWDLSPSFFFYYFEALLQRKRKTLPDRMRFIHLVYSRLSWVKFYIIAIKKVR